MDTISGPELRRLLDEVQADVDARLERAARQVRAAEGIVHLLADSNPTDSEGDRCSLCGGEYEGGPPVVTHESDCPFTLAVEWVAKFASR